MKNANVRHLEVGVKKLARSGFHYSQARQQMDSKLNKTLKTNVLNQQIS